MDKGGVEERHSHAICLRGHQGEREIQRWSWPALSPLDGGQRPARPEAAQNLSLLGFGIKSQLSLLKGPNSCWLCEHIKLFHSFAPCSRSNGGYEFFYQRHFLLNKGRRQDNEEVGLMAEGRAYLVFICKVIGNSLTQFLVDVTATLQGESNRPHFSGEETDTCSCFLRAKLREAGIEL